jgi:hypothetical protein
MCHVGSSAEDEEGEEKPRAWILNHCVEEVGVNWEHGPGHLVMYVWIGPEDESN